MGCWNGTCMLSHLPIIHGNRVVVVPLVYRRTSLGNGGHSPCQYDDLAFPVLAPFRGEYDDYGFVDEIELPKATKRAMLRFLLSKPLRITSRGRMFLKLPHVKGDGLYELQNSDIKHVMTLERLFSPIEQGEVFAPLGAIGFAMVHEELFDVACKQARKDAPHSCDWEPDFVYQSSRMFMPEKLRSMLKEEVRQEAEFTTFLFLTRRLLYPPAGAGSQNTGYSSYVEVMKRAASLCERLAMEEETE